MREPGSWQDGASGPGRRLRWGPLSTAWQRWPSLRPYYALCGVDSVLCGPDPGVEGALGLTWPSEDRARWTAQPVSTDQWGRAPEQVALVSWEGQQEGFGEGDVR